MQGLENEKQCSICALHSLISPSESIRYLNYLYSCIHQPIIIMKKPNPNLNNKPASKPKPSAGFGFGDAMFAVKNLTSDYAQFEDSPTFQQKPPVAIKNPVVNKNPVGFKSPVVPAKKTVTTQPNKIAVVQQKQESNLPKEVFKIEVGNEYKNNLKLIKLNQIQQSESVIQLTANKVGSKWEYNVFCDGVTANKIVEKPEISFRFNGDELKQGQLGNCYFIAALASIAHFPEVLRQRIPEFKKYNCEQKSFRVTMFESGKLIEVIVDNLFPHVYVQPVGNDISPMIIEKAYAQTYGSFEVINVGFAIDALRDLTGAPTEQLSLKDKPFLRSRVAQCFKQQFGLVIASKADNITPLLSAKHSYNILNYQQINGQLFLQLRDPRGWTKASFNTPKKLQNHPENGKFWIGEKDLEANFQMISIGKHIKGYTYFYKTFADKDLTNRTGGLLIYPKTSMKVFVTIHQKHRKFFDENYAYYVMRLLVAEVDGLKVVRTIKTNYKTQQVCTIELDLDPRPHLIIGQIGRIHPKDLFPQEIFTISVYAERRDISFEHVSGNIELKPYLISYMNENRQEFEQYQKNGFEKSYGQLFGYICVYYNNIGEKQVSEEIEYTVKNIEITEKRITLLPKQSKLIMHPIASEAYQCSMKANTLFK